MVDSAKASPTANTTRHECCIASHYSRLVKPGLKQAGVIPHRGQGRETRFCLITTSSGRHWTFPKGIIEPGDTIRAAAVREALEEAGVHGHLVGPQVGTFQQQKWDTEFLVEMYLMTVSRVDETWPEQHLRQRKWCSGEEALALVRGRPVEDVLVAALARLA